MEFRVVAVGPALALAGTAMPSATHQVLVALLLERPEVLTAVLASAAKPGMPRDARIRPATSTFASLSPPSYHADLAFRVEDAAGKLQELVIGEVQLRRDRRKHISWPVYLTAARAEVGLDCPVTLVVVALTPAVARWCAQPIALDRHGSVVQPLVLGPKDIPRIVDIEVARAQPELAVLSALVHARSEDAPQIATAALIACRTLDSEYVSQYADMVEARLDAVARRALEELMEIQGYRYQTAHARKQFAAGEKKGVEKGRKEGRKEGQKIGLQEGLERGRREELASLLTNQLEQRFGALPAYAVRAIAAADVDTLRDLGTRVLTAASLDELLPRPARRRARATAAGTRFRSRAGGKAASRSR
jgi:hypothetical protein